jgi:tRNA threonylcarbamoyladenosine biosynthesis protein TsaE
LDGFQTIKRSAASLFRPMSKSFHTHSAEETVAAGRQIAASLKPPQWVLLIGELGAGKTTLTKGIIAGLGVAPMEDVLSPTFSLIHEYEGPPKVYHIDLYRLDRLPELETLGLDDLWDEPAIVLIEWGEKFAAQLPVSPLKIHLKDLGGDDREIRIEE